MTFGPFGPAAPLDPVGLRSKLPDRHAGKYEQLDSPKIFWTAVKYFDANYLASVKKWKSEKILSAIVRHPLIARQRCDTSYSGAG